jgi:hypothetical protein
MMVPGARFFKGFNGSEGKCGYEKTSGVASLVPVVPASPRDGPELF